MRATLHLNHTHASHRRAETTILRHSKREPRVIREPGCVSRVFGKRIDLPKGFRHQCTGTVCTYSFSKNALSQIEQLPLKNSLAIGRLEIVQPA